MFDESTSSSEGKRSVASLGRELKVIVAEAIYTPDDEMLLAKSRFWRRQLETPMVDINRVTAAHIERVTENRHIVKWWGDQKFREWFLDKDYVVHGLKALAEKGIRVLNDILDDPRAKMASKLKAIELVLSFGDFRPPVKKEVKWMDSELSKMPIEKVQEFLDAQLSQQGYQKISAAVVETKTQAEIELLDDEDQLL